LLFLADENIPSEVATSLTLRGHGVRSMQEFGFGLPDEEVLQKARELGAILLTRDQDFGRLIFEAEKLPPKGVVLFRLPSDLIIRAVESFDELSSSDRPLENCFTTWDKHGIRQRKFPAK